MEFIGKQTSSHKAIGTFLKSCPQKCYKLFICVAVPCLRKKNLARKFASFDRACMIMTGPLKVAHFFLLTLSFAAVA